MILADEGTGVESDSGSEDTADFARAVLEE